MNAVRALCLSTIRSAPRSGRHSLAHATWMACLSAIGARGRHSPARVSCLSSIAHSIAGAAARSRRLTCLSMFLRGRHSPTHAILLSCLSPIAGAGRRPCLPAFAVAHSCLSPFVRKHHSHTHANRFSCLSPISGIAGVLCLSAFAGTAIAAPPSAGLAFDSARVVNLSSRTRDVDAPDAPIAALAADVAATIAAAPALDDGDPALTFSTDAYGCGDAPCADRAERALIDADRTLVARTGATLTITPAHGEPLRFVDRSIAATKHADGDGVRHRYLGRVGAARLARVEVQFEHDAPGTFLVGADGGEVAFVHNGGDVTALAPDTRRIAVMNTLNAPAAIAIADLGDDGPRLALDCGARERGANVVATAKGWRDANTFDVVLTDRGAAQKPTLALRLERVDDAWRVATADAAAPARFGGFSCQEPKR